MATKVDIEVILGRVETVLKDQLSNKLTEISTEKGDSVNLKAVSNDAYFFQGVPQPPNYDPFVIYGAHDDPQTQGIGPATLEAHTIKVVLFCADNGDTGEMSKRMFRYRRALKEVVEENFDDIGHSGFRCVVKNLEIIQAKEERTSQNFMVTGIAISGVIS